MPVDALLGAGALEPALEARAGAELLQAAEDPQLRDQLVRVVHDRRAGQRELERASGSDSAVADARVRLAAGFLT